MRCAAASAPRPTSTILTGRMDASSSSLRSRYREIVYLGDSVRAGIAGDVCRQLDFRDMNIDATASRVSFPRFNSNTTSLPSSSHAEQIDSAPSVGVCRPTSHRLGISMPGFATSKSSSRSPRDRRSGARCSTIGRSPISRCRASFSFLRLHPVSAASSLRRQPNMRRPGSGMSATRMLPVSDSVMNNCRPPAPP